MKQVIIRIIPGITTVYDVIYGHVTDGQFVRSISDDCGFPIPPFVHCDSLLGGTSFIKAKDLTPLICYYQIRSREICLYPNMLVFTLEDSDHEPEKED